MKPIYKILIAVFVLATVTLGVLIYAVPGFNDAFTETSIIEYGDFQVTDDEVCYIVRTEQVYASAKSGNVNYYMADKTQVRKGATILQVVEGYVPESDDGRPGLEIESRLGDKIAVQESMTVPSSGQVSYFLDGYEAYFTPETMRDLKYDEVSALKLDVKNMVRDNTLAGEPLYKVCDNKKWYVIAWVAEGNITKYTNGANMTIAMPAGKVKVKLIDVIKDEDRWLLIFESNRYYEDFAKERAVDATIITVDSAGIVIENPSITSLDGQVGVYRKTRSGDFEFVRIHVIYTDGKRSLVSAGTFTDSDGTSVKTVNNYDEILKKP